MARELTKVHEEFWRGNVSEAAAEFSRRKNEGERSWRGEATLVVQGAATQDVDIVSDIPDLIDECLRRGMSASQACREVVAATGARRKEVYRIALERSQSFGDIDV